MDESGLLFRIGNGGITAMIVLQMLFNTLLYPLLIVLAPTFWLSLKMVAQVNFIYLTIVGFLFGLLIALVPFKGLRYRFRYLRVSLCFIWAVQSVETLALLLMAVMRWGLKYPI